MSTMYSPLNTTSQPQIDLLHWAMLTHDEDGTAIYQSKQVVSKLHLFKRMQPFMLKFDACLTNLLLKYPQLNHQLWQELEDTYIMASKTSDPFDLLQQIKEKRNQTKKIQAKFITEFSQYLQDLKVELEIDHPIWDVCGHFFDDVDKEIKKFEVHRNGDVFNKLIKLIWRKVKAVTSLHTLWELEEHAFERKLKQLRVSATAQLGRLKDIPSKFKTFNSTIIRREELEDIWVEVVHTTLKKLRKGNIELEEQQGLAKLMHKIASNKINAFLGRHKARLSQFEDHQLNALTADDTTDEIDVDENADKDYDLMVSSSKIGFDFLGNAKREKAILYLGYFVPKEYVNELEEKDLRTAYSFEEHETIDQSSILRVLGLAIDPTAISKRIHGDNKKVGGSRGYLRKWNSYTYDVLATLKTEPFKEGQKELIDYYYDLSFLTLSLQDEAPTGNEPWYYTLYTRLKNRVIKAATSQWEDLTPLSN